MSFKVISLVFIVYVCQFVLVSALQKYEFISDCIFYDRSRIPGIDNVTFICSNDRDNRVFIDSSRIRCSKFSSPQDYKWPGTIDFNDCRFTEMPKNFFQMFYNMQTFLMPNVDLESLQMDIFREAKNVSKLDLSGNKLSEIQALVFVNAVNLKDINLSNNVIKRVDKMAFEGAKNIESMNLSCNQIAHLDPLATPKLTTLDISHNNVTILDGNFFDSLIKLKYLNLSYNFLTKLNGSTFDRLLDLEELSLRKTNLLNIEEGTFSHQHKLRLLDLNENNLRVFDFNLFFPIAHDLQTLHLGQNRLADLVGFRNSLFPQLELLDIQGNQFNCSYLRMFMTFIDWEQIHLHLDLSSMNASRSNVRGINCDEINSTDTKSAPMMPSNNEQNCRQYNQMLPPSQASYQYPLNDSVQKITLVVLCAAFMIYLVLYVVVNVDKIQGPLSRKTVSYFRRSESSSAQMNGAEYANDVMLLE